MKRSVLLLIAAAACAVAAVPAYAATKTANVGPRKAFGPRSLTIQRGDTVRFRWTGRLPHNVRVTRGPRRFEIATRRRGTVSRRFTRRGTYSLLCDVHAPDMRMTVRVR